MAKADLTVERLRELLRYEPETGNFYWLKNRTRARAGALAGSLTWQGYWAIGIDQRTYEGHRLAWMYVHGVRPSGQVDHINGVRADNRISNLRDVPKWMNQQNRRGVRTGAKGTLIGTHWSKQQQQWGASIRLHLGYFDTEEEAHEAYLEAKRRLHAGCTI